MNSAYNFSAGPAVFPESVLSEAQNELLDYQGTGMFTALPLNLARTSAADYSISSNFSGNTYKDGRKNSQADYIHIGDNNTIFGTRFNYIPDTGTVPLISDMSSNIPSMPVYSSKYGMIYAGVKSLVKFMENLRKETGNQYEILYGLWFSINS